MKLRMIAAAVLLALLVNLTAFAAEKPAYLFRMIEPIAGERLQERVTAVNPRLNLYRTDDFGVIRVLEAQGKLLYWETDDEVSLFDLSEETTRLGGECWTDALLGLDYARELGIDGAGVRVGLIDSGLRPDFAAVTGANVLPGKNYLADFPEDESDVSDSVGHGTFVASVLASDVYGIAPSVELVPLKCFDGKTSSISSVVTAIQEAVDDFGCDILNLSFGTTSDRQSLRDAIADACEKGVLIVAASGNLSGRVSSGHDPLYYPAAYPDVISVGAVDRWGQTADFSVQNASVSIAAPGAEVMGLSVSGGYHTGGGTSYASPFVTGAAALALCADPSLKPADAAALLESTCTDLGEAGRDNAYGCGLLNVGLLLAELRGDRESVIFTRTGDAAEISVCLPEETEAYQALWVSYAPDGQFELLRILSDGTGAAVNRLRLPEQPGKLLILDRAAWTPLREAIT